MNAQAASRQDVEADIHPDDHLYWFCLTYRGQTRSCVTDGLDRYFTTGGSSAANLASIISDLGYGKGTRVKLLEFASGYGCVSRHIKKNPDIDLTACDIHPAALDFLRGPIGVNAIGSVPDPEAFSVGESYDIVFALSFFSHVPRRLFAPWLRALLSAVKKPGYLVFTTQGLKHMEAMRLGREAMPDGFWFAPESEQKDLDTAQYGTTISLPEFVVSELHRETNTRIVMHKQAYWWEYQDLWVLEHGR